MDFNEIQAGRLNFKFNILAEEIQQFWTNFLRLEMAIKNKSNRWCCVNKIKITQKGYRRSTQKRCLKQIKWTLRSICYVNWAHRTYICIKMIAIFTQKMKQYLNKSFLYFAEVFLSHAFLRSFVALVNFFN